MSKAIECPHCATKAYVDFCTTDLKIGREKPMKNELHWGICPACDEYVLFYEKYKMVNNGMKFVRETVLHQLVYPQVLSRKVSAEVSEPFKTDFREAVAVIQHSPKASAALSRRILQSIIREKAGIKEKDLNKEIDALLGKNLLPSHLSESLHGIRGFGNFAAHPTKDLITGEVIDVEVGEADWLLDIIEGLFDFYFVQPEKSKQRKEQLNEKLKAAGKPTI